MVEHSQGMALLPTDDEGMVQMALRNRSLRVQLERERARFAAEFGQQERRYTELRSAFDSLA